MPLYHCSPAEYSGYMRYFLCHAVNGRMGRNEIRAALQAVGVEPTTQEIVEMIDLLSVDVRGVNWQCFIDYVSDYKSFRDVEQEYMEAFRIYDRSCTGVLTRDDIAYVMKKMGCTNFDLDGLMNTCDTNRDGTLNYDDFCALMKRKAF